MMRDEEKTPAQLIEELTSVRQQLVALSVAAAAHQRAEEALHRHEEQFQKLLEQSIQGISVIRCDGIRVFANPAFARMLGYNHPTEIIGMPFIQHVAPADQDKVRARVEAFFRGERGSTRTEYQAVKKDGSIAWFDHTFTLVLWEGEAALLGTFIDLTERKQAEAALQTSEARYRELFENASDMMYTVDLAGNFIAVNRAVERVTGYPRPALLRMNVADVIAPEFLERSHQMRAKKQAGAKETTYELEIITKSSHRAVVEVSSRFIYHHDTPIGIQGIARDVTERTRLRREVLTIGEQERQRIGQDLHDSLGQYLTGIALLSKTIEQQLIAQAHPATSLAGRIAELVRQTIMHMRHLTAGLWPVDLETRGLVPALQNLATMVESLFEVSCQVVSTPLPELLLPSVALHLYRIVQEAVHNAIRHGQAKQIIIQLALQSDGLTVTVQDDGHGLPEAVESGQGIGLRLMVYRATLIGASLNVHAAACGGTTVTCTIPLSCSTSPYTQGGNGAPA
jgi:PAS domain S-box-containing protein